MLELNLLAYLQISNVRMHALPNLGLKSQLSVQPNAGTN